MNFFIDRPIFATVIALLMVIGGSICIFVLPVAQFPEMAPPQVQLTTQYIGASADVVADTVTTPLEEQINGASGMIYMSSDSTNNGDSVITVTFEVGADQDIGQMELLTRSNEALAELPPEVQQVGLTIEKYAPDLLIVVNLLSPNGTFDAAFLQNYADIHVTDALSRINGVATVDNFGLLKYAIRIWLDPDKLTNLGLTAVDVRNAIQEQNNQVAAGKLGQAPAGVDQVFQLQLNTLGRLSQVEQFADIILRAESNGAVVRIRDVGRVELGAEQYNSSTSLNGQATATLGVHQLSDANGMTIASEVRATMKRLEKNFPDDMTWVIRYDTTEFIKESTKEVVVTLFQAIALVCLVVFVFLQSWRATIIPSIAVPVSLIGTFVFLALFGFSINQLSLLGLVLAVALVVDDAIVVVENVSRRLEQGETDLKKATKEAIAEVRGPIVATTLVMMAVFVPVAFLPGMTGRLYNQFALTIAFSVGLSGINSLTLSPALCAVFLRPPSDGKKFFLFRYFNTGFDRLSSGYATGVQVLARLWPLVMLAFVAICLLTGWLLALVPKGFVPEEDQGYCVVVANTPPGATIARTKEMMDRLREIASQTPGVADIVEIAGYNLIDSIDQPNSGVLFVIFEAWSKRSGDAARSADGIIHALNQQYAEVPEARAVTLNAPPIPGLGTTAGLMIEIQDLNGAGIDELSRVVEAYLDQLKTRPELATANTTFEPDVPQRYINIDRVKVKTRGVSLSDLYDTLQINLGSVYVNEFNKFGRVYRVYIQAEADARSTEDDLLRLRVANSDGEMIELNAFVTVEPMAGPYNIPHYNEYAAVPIIGGPAPGFSSGQSVAAMQEVAEASLPDGFGFEWTGLVFQQQKAGNMAPIVFGLSLVFVFLFLSAQYESWTMPIMVLLAVPLGLFGAVASLMARGMDLDVYGQIGLVMLIGLVAKNGILIVEFAKDRRLEGASVINAAMDAARIRLRPILMTAFAFVIGLIPLVIASGAGANSRRSLGTTVVGGLFAATILIILVPVFYYVIESLRERVSTRRESPAAGSAADTAG